MTHLRRSAALTALLSPILVAACAVSLPDGARAEFARGTQCPAASASVSEWGGQDLAYGTLYRVTGCGKDVIYGCSSTGSSRHTAASAICFATQYCTTEGCDSFEVAARNTFVQQKSCPPERVTAKSQPAPTPPAPPADIASDPERLRLWTQSHPQSYAGLTFMSASGCGAEVTYICAKGAMFTADKGAPKACSPFAAPPANEPAPPAPGAP